MRGSEATFISGALSRLLLLCSLLPGGGSLAYGAPPLTDGRMGLTCDYYFRGALATWSNRGADWVDADGAAQGNLPFAELFIDPGSENVPLDLDVSGVLPGWRSAPESAGLILLRALSGSRGNGVKFRSRESSPDGAQAPILTLKMRDGSSKRLSVTADTTLNCTTRKSMGSRSTFDVGGNNKASLVFAAGGVDWNSVQALSLTLVPAKIWQGRPRLGVFRLSPPSLVPAAPQSGLAEAYSRDDGLEDAPGVFFAANFDGWFWKSDWSTFNAQSNVALVSESEGNGFAPLDGRALRVTFAKGTKLGVDATYRFAEETGKEPERAFFRYYLRLGANWQPEKDGGKLPGFAATYGVAGWGLRPATGINGWSARGGFLQVSPTPETQGYAGIGSYLYHPDTRGGPSEHQGWGIGPSGWLELNRWYAVEQEVRMNTPGERDGILRAWIDGRLAYERTNLRFRDTSALKIEQLWLNVYHGGTTSAHKEMSLYIDNLVIAREYIGPMGDG